MKLKVLTENIKLVPSICEGAEDSIAFIFRQPTQVDITEWTAIIDPKGVIDAMDKLLIEIEGDLVLDDEEGKETVIDSLEQLMQFNSPHITSILSDVLSKFKEIKTQAFTIEKK